MTFEDWFRQYLSTLPNIYERNRTEEHAIDLRAAWLAGFEEGKVYLTMEDKSDLYIRLRNNNF